MLAGKIDEVGFCADDFTARKVGERDLRGLARRVQRYALHDVRHVNAVCHSATHVVFHQLSFDAGLLQLFGVGVFF